MSTEHEGEGSVAGGPGKTPRGQKLADELYESLGQEPVDPAWEDAWSDEIARRLQEIADGKVALVDADEMHTESYEAAEPGRVKLRYHPEARRELRATTRIGEGGG